MKQFKRRTIALVLASVLTVAGAFGAENYKNSLMSLKFEGVSAGSVSMTLMTKRDYANVISPIKKDASTYVIMLPDTNSKMPASPELSGDVESVDVRTMPYTANNRGYTKITIKTAPNTTLTAQKALYKPEDIPKDYSAPKEEVVPVSRPERLNPEYNSNRDYTTPPPRREAIRSQTGVAQVGAVDIKKSVQQFEANTPSRQIQEVEPKNTPVVQTNKPVNNEDASYETLLLILGFIFVVITSVFFVIKAKNKMHEIIGEQPNFSDEEKDKKKKEDLSKRKQIKNTIHKLDRMYSKPVKLSANTILNESTVASMPISQPDDNVVDNIVDLDELFQEKVNPVEKLDFENVEGNDENKALEDFLSGFSFTEELSNEVPTESEAMFNEDAYNKYINDDNLRFSKNDIEKIEKLLSIEIGDDTMKNISKFAITNPIEKKPSKREVLEGFVTSYTVNQNVSFSKEDVDALYKLINVEVDKDFVTDLHTNPSRISEMRKEIEAQDVKSHKTSELLTLNVKDMLPNLSDALKKQGGKRIEYEVKPEVVYYNEGYDVTKLSLDEEFPDLSKAVNDSSAYKERPSDSIQLVESGYDVAKLAISSELPDLSEALKNPNKYTETKEIHTEVDENALLNNISNVNFKPFYDGSEEFEVLNEFDENNAPTVSDMQAEFKQFNDGFEIIKEDEEENVTVKDDSIDDFESLYDNTYVDFDVRPEELEFSAPNSKKETSNLPKLERKVAKVSKYENTGAEDLIKEIEAKKAKKQIIKQTEMSQREAKKAVENDKNTQLVDDIDVSSIETFVVNDEIYKIVSKTNFTDKLGCYLAKNTSGYSIIGFVGDKLFKIKNYEKLKTESIQSRVSEKLNDGTTRYLVRIGIHKFILNVKDDKMEYVMDLC